MSHLNLTITEEEQKSLENELVGMMGREIVNSYGSVTSQLLSATLVAQQKPQGIEELLAVQEVYGNAMKLLFGIDEESVNIEKVKAYHNIESIIKQIKEESAPAETEEVAESTPVSSDVVEDVVVDTDADVVEA